MRFPNIAKTSKRRTIGVILLSIAAVLITLISLRTESPDQQEEIWFKSLAPWSSLKQIAPATNFWPKISPEGTEFLLKKLRRQESAFEKCYRKFWFQLPEIGHKFLRAPASPEADRMRAAFAFGKYGPQPGAVELGLIQLASSDPDGDVRAEALLALINWPAGENKLIPLLLKATKDSYQPVRSTAVRALAFVSSFSDDVEQALIAALGDPDVAVRQGAQAALLQNRWARKRQYPTIWKLTKSSDENVRLTACSTLVQLGIKSPELVQILTAMLSSTKELNRREAVALLGGQGPLAKPALPQLVALLDRMDSSTQATLLWSIGQIGPGPELMPTLTRFLNSTNGNVRSPAVFALGAMGPAAASAVPALVECLSSDRGPRNNAANALGRIGPAAKSALPVLRRLVEDPDFMVQQNAAFAIWRIARETNHVSILVRGLDQARKSLVTLGNVSWLCGILGEMGPAASDAIPILDELCHHEQEYIRIAATNALEKIKTP